ncbi:TPA: hypothetical protein L5606_005875 [Pseudomonas aeruginosa]|uniref:hypothetical protein n=1 Tax=Pseudomonas aeruginosa TaxID=287 RepID=UPI0004D34CD8|nr:hypothetical protein [Pseudomonas aeruginosa]KEF91752.1 hypothetical protein RLJV_15875 [Pseudomonas aeruginosa]MBV5822744.1 hypothetical protein [Pseudomonas aeruginosa]MDG3888414.1 hypothetical protein [Pseudomonas aeruginosa]HBP4587299.1 hypothetical protein [Pseudomonas aeruginosa]
MTIRTLSRWVDRLLKGATTIECPHMEIQGYDHEPPVFTGPGQIVIDADTRMHFTMHGTPHDGSAAFRKIMDAQNNPYDGLRQFRMNAVDYDGTEWSGGWTKLRTGAEVKGVWRLFGPIQRLHTQATGFGVAEMKGVELVYDRIMRLPIPMNMVKTVKRGDEEVLWSRSSGTQTVEVLDATIEFFQSAEHEHIWVVAEETADFPHPYLENWLSEPLNLLLGEIISPRLQARNFGDGRASISLRSTSGRAANSLAGSIMREVPRMADERFWSLYRDILTIVATARDVNGHQNFEAHPLTHYYWEIIQATQGSNWVLCMTLASTVEGLIKMMFSEIERKSDHDDAAVNSLKSVIGDWKGAENLRSQVLQYLDRFKTKGTNNLLRSLIGTNGITSEQVSAWIKLRHSSMHGDMVMPWSSEEQDKRINNLIELTHRLSETYIKRELSKRGRSRM